MSPWLAVFRIDLRSLALGRILLGIIICFDLLFALARRHQYYTELGVLPRSAIGRLETLETKFSIYFLVGWPPFTLTLMLVTLAVAISFTLGYRSRLSSILLWFGILSLQERNHWILIGGDAWLRATLFWLMFLPLGEHFSLDRSQSGKKPSAEVIANAATVGLVLQVVYVYLWAGFAKNGEDWWQGKALYYVMAGKEFSYGLASYALYFPTLLAYASILIPWLEVVASLALITPYKHNYCRSFGALCLIAMHIGIWCTMELYHFSAIAISTLLILMPAWIWRSSGESRFFPSDIGPKLSVLLLLITVCTWAYNPLRFWKKEKIPWSVTVATEFMGFQQIWKLFAPMAPRGNPIIYAVAELEDGSFQHLSFWGRKVAKPPGQDDPEFEVRLSRYWRSLLEGDQRTRFHYHAAWYSRLWARLYPEQADQLKIMRLYYQYYPTSPDFEDLPPEPAIMVAEYRLPE